MKLVVVIAALFISSVCLAEEVVGAKSEDIAEFDRMLQASKSQPLEKPSELTNKPPAPTKRAMFNQLDSEKKPGPGPGGPGGGVDQTMRPPMDNGRPPDLNGQPPPGQPGQPPPPSPQH